MNAVNPDYPYTIEKNGDVAHITYRKGKFGNRAALPIALYLAIPCIVLILAIKPSSAITGIFLWALFTVGFSFLIVFLVNVIRPKKGEFTLSKDSIIVKGKSYALEHVRTISIKDPSGEYVTETIIVSNPGSLSSGVQGANREIGKLLESQTRQMQFKLVLRYASKDVVFAKGLSENDAEELFAKVTQMTGYTKSV